MNKIGLTALFETAEFTKGLNTYLRGLGQAESKTGEASKASSGLANILTTAVGTAFGYLAGQAIPAVVGGIRKFIDMSVMAAARAEEMSLALNIIGKNAGYSAQEMDLFVAQVMNAGIRMDVAQKSLLQLARYNVDLSKATDLARVAQDAAIVSAADSSDTLDRMIWGISTYNTRILRTAGLQVNMGKAFADTAKELGKSTNALTDTEKQTAALNAVLEAGVPIVGAYDAAMESAGKQLRSFVGREIPEILRVLGEPFQDAFSSIVFSVRGVAKNFLRAISPGLTLAAAMDKLGISAEEARQNMDRLEELMEDGKLYSLLRTLGAVVAIIAEEIAAFAKKAGNEFIDFVADSETTLEDAAWKALEWGVNISTNLARGIIEGANQALTAAMNFIQGILTFWLKGRSPPKVAPDLPEWGANAINEWLHGFTEGDFDILKSIRRPLKTALDLIAASDLIDKDAVEQIYSDIGEGLAEAIANWRETGVMDPAIFETLRSAAGEFGDELATLLEYEIQLAAATEDLEAAQEAYNDAVRAQVEAQNSVRDLRREYNQMLRAGASEEELQNKLDELNAAQEQADVAAEQQEQAKEAVENAKDAIDPLQEQLGIQKEIVDTMLDLAKAAEDARKIEPLKAIGGGGIGGGGGFGGDDDPLGISDIGGGIGNEVDEAFEELKARVREKLLIAFRPAADLIDEIKRGLGLAPEETVADKILGDKMGPSPLEQNLTNLRLRFDEFKEALTPVWERLQDIFEKTDWEKVIKITGWVVGLTVAIGLAAIAIGILTSVIGFLFSPIGLLIAAIGIIIWKWDEAAVAAQQLIAILLALFARGLVFIVETAKDWGDAITEFVAKGKEEFDEFKQQAILIITSLMYRLTSKFEEIKTKIVNKIAEMVVAVLEKFNTLKTDVETKIDEIKTAIEGKVEKFTQAGRDLIDGLKSGIEEKAQSIIDAAVGAVQNAIDAAKALLGISSPSKEFQYFGEMMMEGMAVGIDDASKQVEQALSNTIAGTKNMMMQGLPATQQGSVQNVTNTYTAQFGDSHIYSQAEGEMFQMRVERAMRKVMSNT